MLLFILLFSIYAWLQLFDMFCRILDLFTQHLTLNGCIFTSLMDTYVMLCPWSKKRIENRFQPKPQSDRGVCHGLRCVEKLLPLHLPMAMWLKTTELSYKRGSFNSRREGHMHEDIDRKQARVAQFIFFLKFLFFFSLDFQFSSCIGEKS